MSYGGVAEQPSPSTACEPDSHSLAAKASALITCVYNTELSDFPSGTYLLRTQFVMKNWFWCSSCVFPRCDLVSFPWSVALELDWLIQEK